ncbi:MAG: UDP-N-acetylmuramoyl-L-alanyl-D-glutamate--2,6-diaminopimelate ligase, partial [Syntrophomonadaceae bacterium]|nr:UDP-N-acetylmuramoyl-L-alanyl-D-glutamate--2,6-diaminopimelate ligase [Syntrophomonadaceae bacterium]
MKKYSIEEYIQLIESNDLLIYHDLPRNMAKKTVEKVAYNSHKVGPDTLFICKGLGFKEEYLDTAIRNGAIMYISEVNYHKPIPCLIVNDIQKTLSHA